MNNREYEQKKKKCWEEYLAFNDEEYSKSAFSYAFNRAYSLGKQTQTTTQEEIEKAAEKHADELRVISGIPGALVPMLHDIAKSSYLQGAQDFLGKQEKDADTVIQGWAARDEDGHLFMYCTKPERDEALQVWMGRYADFDLRNALFPDLTWESDPEEVELIIRRKKKWKHSIT